MKEFVEYIIKNLVDSPADVDINCVEGEKNVIVEIRVGKEDVGKVVGRGGITIKALRTVSALVCARFKKQVRVELLG